MVGRLPPRRVPLKDREQTAAPDFPSGHFREEGAPSPLADQRVNFGHQRFGKDNVSSVMCHVKPTVYGIYYTHFRLGSSTLRAFEHSACMK